MSKFLRNWLLRSVGLIIFALILRTIDFTKIGLIIRTSERLWVVFLALPLTFVIVSIRFYRWYRIARYEEISMPLWEGLLIYIAGFGLGIATPGRVGELIKVNYLRNSGYLFGKAFFTVLLDRASDILLMTIFALLGIYIFMHAYQTEIAVVSSIFTLLAGGLFFFAYKRGDRLKSNRAHSKSGGNLFAPFFREIDNIPSYFRRLGWVGMIDILMVSLVSWLIFFLQNYLFSFSFDFGLTFFQIAFVTSFVGLANLVPISVLGLGTRDLALIYLFVYFGLLKEQALLFSGCMLLTVVIPALVSLVPWEMQNIRENLLMYKKQKR